MKTRNFILPIVLSLTLTAHSQSRDSELLGKALEYYGGQKYHESLLAFKQLGKTYKLNPRFMAYMGVCYFKEQKYEEATAILDKVTPDLDPFPPHERAMYYFANAESHFFMANDMEYQANSAMKGAAKEYDTAAKYYEKAIDLCFAKEKGDIYYRLGFCRLLNVRIAEATEYFTKAKAWYDKYGSMDAETSFRKKQTENMLRTLLVSHGAGRMNEGDKETWENENKNADNKGGNVEQNK